MERSRGESKDHIREILNTCKFLDDDRDLRRELEIHGERILDECERKLKELEKELENLTLPWIKEELGNKIKDRLIKIKELREGKPDVEVACGTTDLFEGKEVPVAVHISNPRASDIDCRVTLSGDFDIFPYTSGKERIEKLGGKLLEFTVKPRALGRKVLSVRVDVEGRGQTSVSKEVRFNVNPYISLQVDMKASKHEVLKNERISLTVSLRNESTVPLSVELQDPFERSIHRLTVEPRREKRVDFTGRVPESGIIELPPIRYRDTHGREYVKELEPLRLEVKPLEEKPREELRKHEEKVQPAEVDLESALSELSKHILVAFVGKVLGERLFREKREYSKPVLVADLPYVVQEDVTVVFEDPVAVIEEDRESYIIVRRAKPAELESIVTATAAKALVSNFKLSVEPILRSWSPFGETDVLVREKSVTEDALKELVNRGRADVKDLRSELPENFYLECTYKERKFMGKTLLKVYAGACSRLKTLAERGRDDKPLDLGEAFDLLKLSKPSESGITIYLLASPTGWDSTSKEVARKSYGKTLYLLVNLKTGEVYYNSGEGLARSLVETLGYMEELPLHDKRIIELDKLLLEGKINEEVYRDQISTLLKS